MKILLLCIAQSLCFIASSQSSIGIGTTSPNPSALVELSSTDKGLLIPRMTTAQRIAIVSPAAGLLVFDTDVQSFYYRTGNTWLSLQAARMLADSDGDTKMQVEELTDEDIIRMDLAGAESLVLRRNLNDDVIVEPGGVGENNLFIGFGAGNINTGNFNLALGYLALNDNLTGYGNVALGYLAMPYNEGGYNNTVTGREALFSNTSGYANTASGYRALYDNISGFGNTVSGYRALHENIGGDYNIASGYQALHDNTYGNQNIASGYESTLNNTTGSSNIAIGTRTLYRNTDRNSLIAIGDSALYNNGMGVTQPYQATANTAVGSQAMYSNSTGWANTAIGKETLLSNTTGYFNTAAGIQALYHNTSGLYNTALGSLTLFWNSTGDYNTANGYYSLYLNSLGNQNTASGWSALHNNTTGSYNAATGTNALIGNESGDFRTAIGYSSNSTGIAYINNTGLGNNADCTASNQVRIGNTAVTSIGGYDNWTNISDSRFKNNIQETVPGIAFIQQLRPVTYHLDLHAIDDFFALHYNERDSSLSPNPEKEKILYSGFIAQEVEAAAGAIGYEFSGVNAPKNDKDFYGLRYAEFVVPLVKAMQEQQAMIESQQNMIATMQTELEALQTIVTSLQIKIK